MQNLVPTFRPVPDFAPVPRKYRYDGWTAERQRGFIAALAETGSVKAAAKRINMSPEGAYLLRRQPGADSFRAAWEAALDHGVQRLVDIAIERATEGVSVPIFWRGEQVGEKRWFNDRLLMFVLRQLTHIELILACGGKAMELIDLCTQRPTDSGRGFVEPEADPLSELLDRIRQKAWAAAGDPPRPPLPLDRRECPGSGLWGGPTMREREKARQAAEAKMARAQREWEAAQREDSWAAWKGTNG